MIELVVRRSTIKKRENRYTPFNPKNTESQANDGSSAARICSTSSTRSQRRHHRCRSATRDDDGTRNQRGARNADFDGIVHQRWMPDWTRDRENEKVVREGEWGNKKVDNTRGVSACVRGEEISPNESRRLFGAIEQNEHWSATLVMILKLRKKEMPMLELIESEVTNRERQSKPEKDFIRSYTYNILWKNFRCN